MGADISIRDNFGMTAFQIAADRGHDIAALNPSQDDADVASDQGN